MPKTPITVVSACFADIDVFKSNDVPEGIYAITAYNPTPKSLGEEMFGIATFPWQNYVFRHSNGDEPEYLGGGSSVVHTIKHFELPYIIFVDIPEEQKVEQLAALAAAGYRVTELHFTTFLAGLMAATATT